MMAVGLLAALTLTIVLVWAARDGEALEIGESAPSVHYASGDWQGHRWTATGGSSDRPRESRTEEPRYYERPAGEWGGMLVRRDMRPVCAEADGCGLALACIDGLCSPCRGDRDCAYAEICALDHCLREELGECTSAAECPEDSLCVLSGYSPGVRGNETMISWCLGRGGPVPEGVAKARGARAAGVPAADPPIAVGALIEQVRAARQERR